MKKIPCDVYTRVVGFYSPLSNWNNGKIAEYKMRKVYELPEAQKSVEINVLTMPYCSACQEAKRLLTGMLVNFYDATTPEGREVLKQYLKDHHEDIPRDESGTLPMPLIFLRDLETGKTVYIENIKEVL